MAETIRNSFPIILGASGTGATFWLSEYGLPWIGGACGLLTIIHLCLSIKKQLK